MTRQASIASERAARVLVYYVRTIWQRAGLEWTSDNESEVRGIIEDTIEAANG